MVRLVLFDIDGTLVRTGGAGVEAFRTVFASEFKATDGFEQLKFAGGTDPVIVQEFFATHQIPPSPENFQRFFERYVFWLDQMLPQRPTQICAGVGEFIRDLRALSKPPLLGLLTGNIRLGAEIKLRHFNMWQEFETGAFADDADTREQIAAVARDRGSRALGEKLRGEQILVVGDTPRDIRCGRSIGAKVLAVATGGATLDELRHHNPDWAVRDLTQVSAGEVCSLKPAQEPSFHRPSGEG